MCSTSFGHRLIIQHWSFVQDAATLCTGCWLQRFHRRKPREEPRDAADPLQTVYKASSDGVKKPTECVKKKNVQIKTHQLSLSHVEFVLCMSSWFLAESLRRPEQADTLDELSVQCKVKPLTVSRQCKQPHCHSLKQLEFTLLIV